MRLMRTLVLPGAALLLVASPLSAQSGEWGRGGFEVSVYGGVLNGIGSAEFDSDPLAIQADNDVLFGGRVGYVLPNNVFIEGNVGYLSSTLSESGRSGPDAKLLNYGGRLGYAFQLEPKALQLFVAVGAGAQSWDVDGFSSKSTFSFDYGAGVKAFISPSIALRVDWHNYVSDDGLDDVRQALNPGADLSDESLTSTEFSAGLAAFFGGPRDSDGDGIINDRDQCPDTPRGVSVDSVGCPVDGDADGVADYLDRCPDTPVGARVDESGCPTDADGDGVFDGIDQCANTPAGARVDETGCPIDSDGDGVADGIDQCPNTPADAEVDDEGCPMDSDGDGVFDGIDQCPNTAEGAEVDDRGCTVVQAGIAAGLLVLQNVEFEFNSFELKPAARATLDEVGQALLDRPDVEVEVQGHTDSTGSEAYNLGLSQRRAQAVLDYLLSQFPDLGADRFEAKGYGEADPIADNGTPEGQARNRRVQFVIKEQ